MFQALTHAPAAFFVFLCTVATSIYAFREPRIIERFILAPSRVVHQGEWSRMFTCTLVHGDWMHLIFNMATFASFAPILEKELHYAYGGFGFGFILFYLASCLISHTPEIIQYHNDPSRLSLGASGAILAIVFGFILLNPFARLGLLFIPVPIPAWLFGILYLFYTVYASRQPAQVHVIGGGNINHGAHLWGAVAGLLLTPLFRPDAVLALVTLVTGQ